MPNSKCTNCGKVLDAASAAHSEEAPEPSDITVCIYCGHIMAYADDMSLRNLNDEEIGEVARDPTIVAIQKARGTLDGK